jgi:hypothetical protein
VENIIPNPVVISQHPPPVLQANASGLWDPVGISPDMTMLQNQEAKVAADYAKVKASKIVPQKKFLLLLLFAGICWIIFWVGHFDVGLTYGLVLLPAIIYYSIIRAILIKEIRLNVAEQLHCQYLANPDSGKWNSLASICPSIFNKGNDGQEISNQMWGSVTLGGKEYSLWIGLFRYENVSHDAKGNRQVQTYYETVYAFHLLAPAITNFSLNGRTFLSRFTLQQPLETESVDFNKAFVVGYRGDRGLVGPEIFRILNPGVMERFLAFNSSFHPQHIVFEDDSIFISFNGDTLISDAANWSLSTTISPDDVATIQAKLQAFVELAVPIVSQVGVV